MKYPLRLLQPVLIEELIEIVTFDQLDPTFRGWKVAKIEIDPMQVDYSEIALTVKDISNDK